MQYAAEESMAKPSKTAKLVITSIVITLIVLAAFTLVFINFIVPAYQITEDQIYSVLTRLFPVLIGLILIQIGVMAAKKGEPEYKDTIDKLSPNAYDSSLYTEPKDDPMLRGKVAPEVFGTGTRAAAQTEVKEVIKEVPVEVVKEVPVEVVREVEVPVERIREIQVPVEVIKEVAVGTPDAVLSFHDVLKEESKAAEQMAYDLSVVAIKERDGLTEESIEASFGEDTLVFSENGCFFAVLPFYTKEEAENATEALAPRNVVTVSAEINPEEFIQEASRF